MKAFAETNADALTMVSTDAIVQAGLNPREVDRDSEAFQELRTSIENRGILQPLLLRRGSSGTYEIVAGHRRLACAEDLKLQTVPALVVDLDDHAARIASITENVQRENMTPIEEARAIAELRERMGLRQVDAAQVLGKSERWARERERLLEMPDIVVEAIDSGAVPLEATVHLQRISEKAPTAAELLVEPVVDHETGEIIEDNRSTLTSADSAYRSLLSLDRSPEAEIVRVHRAAGWLPVSLPQLTKVQRARVEHALDGEQVRGLPFETEDVDAARVYGCLLELEGKAAVWVTDMEWLTDRLVQIAERQVKERRVTADPAAPPVETDSDEDDAQARAEAEAAERERAERAMLRQEQLRADANLVSNLEGMKSPAITTAFARAITVGVIDRFDDWALADLAEHDPRLKEDARNYLLGRVAQLKQPADILALAMRVMLWDVVKFHNEYQRVITLDIDQGSTDRQVSTYIEKWAMESGLLPQPHRDEIERRWHEIQASRQKDEDEVEVEA